MTLGELKGALLETAKLTVMIFTIIWGVLLYVRFLGFADLPSAFSDWITSLDQSPMLTLLMILLAYAILGMFMDAIGMLLLTLPVVYNTGGYDSPEALRLLDGVVELLPAPLDRPPSKAVRPDGATEDVAMEAQGPLAALVEQRARSDVTLAPARSRTRASQARSTCRCSASRARASGGSSAVPLPVRRTRNSSPPPCTCGEKVLPGS